MASFSCSRVEEGGTASTVSLCIHAPTGAVLLSLSSPAPLAVFSQVEARLLRDEVHGVTVELQSRQLALTKLQRKHETLLLKGRTQDGAPLLFGGRRHGVRCSEPGGEV